VEEVAVAGHDHGDVEVMAVSREVDDGSMSRFALTLPSPYLRMSLLTTLYWCRARN
jgi:hypothetical protein